MGDRLYRIGDAQARFRAVVHGGGVVLAAFVVGIVLSLVGAVVVRGLGASLDPPSPEVTAALTALQFVGFLAVGFAYLRWIDDAAVVYRRRPTLRDVAWIGAGLIALAALTLGLNTLLSWLELDVAANDAITQGRDQPRLLLYFAVGSILFVAPGEELIFRGIVQGALRRAYGVLPAVVATAAVFGLVHYVALGGSGSRWIYLAIAALLGLVLGAIYERTESIAVPVAIHGLWNAGQFLLVYAEVAGGIGF
jgi:membrane protease YdiL (CAAX protease family)